MKKNTIALAMLSACAMTMCVSLSATGNRPDNLAPVSVMAEEQDRAKFLITYMETSGYNVGSQEISYSGEGIQTLNQADLQIPSGYALAQEWLTYQAEPGGFNYVTIAVAPTNPTLAQIYNAQGDQQFSVLTINYWLEDGTLVNSQTFQYFRASAGGTPVYTLNENYVVNVPAGYTLITPAPESIQIGPNSRGVTNLYVARDGTGLDGSADALFAAQNGTKYLGEGVSEDLANAIGRPDLVGKEPLMTILGEYVEQPAETPAPAPTKPAATTPGKKSPETGVAPSLVIEEGLAAAVLSGIIFGIGF